VKFPTTIQNLIDSLTKIPGVGEKTAIRQTLVMANWKQEDLMKFGRAISALASIKKCKICGMFADHDLCQICSSYERFNSPILCIIESISDCIAIERGGYFKGKYHVLGNLLNPLLGIGPREINLENITNRIHNENIQEIILALSPSIEGDATSSYIKQMVPSEVIVGTLGLGIPMGGNLEYLDALTISKAIEHRRAL